MHRLREMHISGVKLLALGKSTFLASHKPRLVVSYTPRLLEVLPLGTAGLALAENTPDGEAQYVGLPQQRGTYHLRTKHGPES